MSLTWLPLSTRKAIPAPKLIIEPYKNQNYGGYYVSGASVLVVVESDIIESSIAHEYRHYVQDYTNKFKPKISTGKYWNTWYSKLDYDEAITRYFSSFASEFDALLFEYKVAKSWVNEHWLRELMGYKL